MVSFLQQWNFSKTVDFVLDKAMKFDFCERMFGMSTMNLENLEKIHLGCLKYIVQGIFKGCSVYELQIFDYP